MEIVELDGDSNDDDNLDDLPLEKLREIMEREVPQQDEVRSCRSSHRIFRTKILSSRTAFAAAPTGGARPRRSRQKGRNDAGGARCRRSYQQQIARSNTSGARPLQPQQKGEDAGVGRCESRTHGGARAHANQHSSVGSRRECHQGGRRGREGPDDSDGPSRRSRRQCQKCRDEGRRGGRRNLSDGECGERPPEGTRRAKWCHRSDSIRRK